MVVVMLVGGGLARGESMPLRVLWERSLENGASSEAVQVAGRVLVADPSGGRLALADGSGAVILALKLREDDWKEVVPGQVIELEVPPGRVVRRGFEIDCGGGPLIDVDGSHPPLEQRGAVFLRQGRHPLLVEWFNGAATSVLQLGVEGPGGKHGAIPGDWLSHDGGKAAGLSYERFRLKEIGSVDELPAGGNGDERGVVSRIDEAPAEGLENVALRFTGEIEVPMEGVYVFTLKSDDGARAHVGATQPTLKVRTDGEMAADASALREIEGEITYAVVEGRHLRLEVAMDQRRSEVIVLNPAGLDVRGLLGRRVRASGIGHEGGVCVLSAAGVSFDAPGGAPARQLTLASQIRELQPEEAALNRPVVLQGVVTMSNYRSLVLQDDSGGVFVLANSPPPEPLPEPGERWMVEGRTAPGDFSPMVIAERCRFLGAGALPQPRRPNREEILNGSPDAELVEIEGVVISIGEDRIELLTRDEETIIQSKQFYPLPGELFRKGADDLTGSRLKLRGVFATSWNRELGRLTPGVIGLGNAGYSVVERAPGDPAEVPLVTVPDLWRFTSKSTALDRVRLKGMLMASDPDTVLVSENGRTFRLASSSTQGAQPGDEVEVTGFARTGPISPVIVHPEIRVISRGTLPAPVQQDPSMLPDLSLDGKPVRIHGRVISDTIQKGERRLELEAESLRFLVVGISAHSGPADVASFQRDSRVSVDGVYFATLSDPVVTGPGDFEIRMTGKEQELRLISSPPWWTTRRLLLLIAVLLGGLALVIAWAGILQRMVRNRTSELAVEIAKKEHAESERALEQERARVARDLHDELGAGLTEIGLLGSLVGNPNIAASAKENYIETLGGVSRSLVSSLDEIVWAINPDYDSVDDLAGYLWLHAQRLLKPAGMECPPVKPVVIPGGRLGSLSRQSLLLAFKEALNNVIKHSGATHVDLGIRVEKEKVIISIADNGTGLPPETTPVPGHQGISGMHKRMHELGGECEITVRPGGGTIVHLSIPLESP